MTPWIVVTVVSKSATSCEIETFMTAASSTIRNCEAASTIRTRRLDTGSALRVVVDRSQDASGRARRDRVRGNIARDDAVGADHGALADRHPARDDDVRAAPDVVADARGPLGREALPRHRQVGVVEAVAAIRHEAAVGEHAVLADLDELDGGDHHAA